MLVVLWAIEESLERSGFQLSDSIGKSKKLLAIIAIARAAFGYLFLVLMVRIVGRRPGKQLTPFEFVLIFYLGGLTLTGMVGDDVSFVNAVTQILTVAVCHYLLSFLRFRIDVVTQILDGTPLVLLKDGYWRTDTLSHMRLQDDDVMAAAREKGIRDLQGIKRAALESFGEITVVADTESAGSDNRDSKEDQPVDRNDIESK